MAIERKVTVEVDLRKRGSLGLQEQVQEAREAERAIARVQQAAGRPVSRPGSQLGAAVAENRPGPRQRPADISERGSRLAEIVQPPPFQSERVREAREQARADAARPGTTTRKEMEATASAAVDKLRDSVNELGFRAINVVPGMGELVNKLSALKMAFGEVTAQVVEAVRASASARLGSTAGGRVAGLARGAMGALGVVGAGLAGGTGGAAIGESLAGRPGAVAGGALGGAAAGAMVGSILPGVGTAVGAAVGGVVGLVTGGFRALTGGAEAAKRTAEQAAQAFEGLRARAAASADAVSRGLDVRERSERGELGRGDLSVLSDFSRERILAARDTGGEGEAARVARAELLTARRELASADRSRLGGIGTAGDVATARSRVRVLEAGARGELAGVTGGERGPVGFGESTSLGDSILSALAGRTPGVEAAERGADATEAMRDELTALRIAMADFAARAGLIL